jgi:hypothetical protein
MSVIWMQREVMIGIPRVKNGLLSVMWDQTCLVKWAASVMGLSFRMAVQLLKVYCSSWFAIFLASNNHPVAQ